jgi:hypothetical protein
VTAPHVNAAARRNTDWIEQTVTAAAASVAPFVATVTAVTAGAARDGTATVTAKWRGKTNVIEGYLNSYTPAIGDRVVCVSVDSQVFILGRIIGCP